MRSHMLPACALILTAVPAFAHQATVGGPDQLSAPGAVTGPGVGFDRDPAPLGEADNNGLDERERAAIDSGIDSPPPFDRPDIDDELPGTRLPGGAPPGVNGMIGGETRSFGPPPAGDSGDDRGFGGQSNTADDSQLGKGSSDPRDARLGR